MDDCSRAGRAKARAEQRCVDKFNALRQARLALKTGHGHLLGTSNNDDFFVGSIAGAAGR